MLLCHALRVGVLRQRFRLQRSLQEQLEFRGGSARMARLEWSETEDIKEWDDFVIQNNGSIYHSWSWRGVLETTGARPLYLVSRDRSGRTIAVCPFFCEKASRHFSILESLPLSHMAGPIIAPQVTDISEILESLPRSVRSPLLEPIVAMEINVLHQSLVRSLTNSGFNCEANQGLFVLDLVEKKPEDIWNREFEKHDRQAVKYYEEQGASFGFAHLDNEFEDYFALHQDSIIRKNRKPLIQPEFLSKMRVNMGEQLKVAVVKFDNELIGGFSVLCDRRNSTVHF